jgi:hypothetical protein
MFNLKKALSQMDQGVYGSWDSIKFELSDVVWNNRRNLAPGFNSNDLFTLAVEYGYIKQYSDGSMKVDLK